MRSSLVVRASDCQCTSCNGPGFDPSIRQHSGIWGAADEAVLNIVRKKILKKIPQKKFKKKKKFYIYIFVPTSGSSPPSWANPSSEPEYQLIYLWKQRHHSHQ